jgi:hypothetical protein
MSLWGKTLLTIPQFPPSNRASVKKAAQEHAKEEAAAYSKLHTQRIKEQKAKRASELAKRRSSRKSSELRKSQEATK